MAITSATTAELATFAPRAGTHKLEIRTAWQGWQEFGYLGKQPNVTSERDLPRTCTFSIINQFDPLTGVSIYADESDQSNYIQEEAEVRVTALVLTAGGLEMRVLFLGRIDSIALNDYSVAVTCSDWKSLINERECDISREPTEYQAVAPGVRKRLQLHAHGIYGRVYGLTFAEVPYAFNTVGTPGEVRRPWVITGAYRVWKHASLTDDSKHPTYEVPHEHFKVDGPSGAMSLFEPSIQIHDFPSGTTLRLPGNREADYYSGVQFEIALGDNAGSYTLTADSSYNSTTNFTTLTAGAASFDTSPADLGVVYYDNFWIEDVRVYLETGGTTGGGPVGANCDLSLVFIDALTYPKASGGMGLSSGEYSIPTVGIDLGTPVVFRGKVADLFSKIASDFQANVRYRFNPSLVRSGSYPTWETGKHIVQVVTQKGTPDWDNAHPLSINQQRTNRDLVTRVVATGQSEQPLNLLCDGTVTSAVTQGDFFPWDGVNILPDEPAGAHSYTLPLAFNGNDALACAVHNLPGTPDEEGETDEKYSGWYKLFDVDLGSIQRIDRVRVVMPPTRHPKAAGGDQRIRTGGNAVGFWPGIWLRVSQDSSEWFLIAPGMKGNFAPSSVLDLTAEQITRGRFRYMEVLCMAYKHSDAGGGLGGIGGGSHNDPVIGVGEIALYGNNEYRIEKSILATAGDYYFTSDVNQANPVSREYPDILTACADGYKTKFIDLGTNYNEFLAHDVALLELLEGLRLYASPQLRTITDPRVDVFETMGVVDALNGNTSILIETVSWADHQTNVTGTNYNSGVWKS